ncbi:hypothetical protein D3C73_1421110 [compost metagenome]
MAGGHILGSAYDLQLLLASCIHDTDRQLIGVRMLGPFCHITYDNIGYAKVAVLCSVHLNAASGELLGQLLCRISANVHILGQPLIRYLHSARTPSLNPSELAQEAQIVSI